MGVSGPFVNAHLLRLELKGFVGLQRFANMLSLCAPVVCAHLSPVSAYLCASGEPQHFALVSSGTECHVIIFCLCHTQLNNRLFEELAMDVYDEVDRRENDAGMTLLFSSSLFLLLSHHLMLYKH